ncbi:uncharacterized protein LOC128986521 [Macrosteles quadrilineatus]|uniref:uncharacterized protein LOC128986521 n=1 Tax=Macrosteles quadrilineatus TaxID=74068 RepID=UPI0023E1DD22|nr:uncharacterized protein LOC128986521 [Macrosteles quadrilineatus]
MISLLILVAVCSVAQAAVGFGYPAAYPPTSYPLAVIAESPYSTAKYLANVPLVMVDQNRLNMIRNAEISGVSPTEPLVTCRTGAGQGYYTEAMPAVQVVLKRPLYISPQQHSIPFPAELSVLYGGLRMGLPVGSVVAPVPHQGLDRPQLVRVVYAIPSGPLPLQYPYYDPFAYSSPAYQQTQVLPVSQFQPSYTPAYYTSAPAGPAYYNSVPTSLTGPAYYNSVPGAPAVPSAPTKEVSNAIDVKRPKPQTVTVLNFPSSVATPEVLYYQPPLGDSELGNRGPPEAIAPAGIVQSTQPVASLESFLNSKESTLLNSLREQAEKNKDKEDSSNEGVLAL